MQKDIYQQSLDLHKRYHGKIETTSKIKLDSREALSLAYTPGVAEACREIARDPPNPFAGNAKELPKIFV